MFSIDHRWSLFLDRDGVLNAKRENDYVKRWDEFEFLPGVLAAMQRFSACFGRIIVVTNQRGVGRGLMSARALEDIHERMQREIETHGRIDRILHCPDSAENDVRGWRKPEVEWPWRRTHLRDRLGRSIMIADSISDMAFGRSAGMHTLWISTAEPSARKPH